MSCVLEGSIQCDFHSFITAALHSIRFNLFDFSSFLLMLIGFDLLDTLYCNFDVFCYFIDVNHMRMSDGTNKAITYLLTSRCNLNETGKYRSRTIGK